MNTTTVTQLADALRVFLECYESTRDHGGGWPKYVPDNAREALAAYDAQQTQQADAFALIRDIALTEAGSNSEPDVMGRALDDIIGRCQGFIANAAIPDPA